MSNYIDWAPDGTKLISAYDNSVARVWDAYTWEPLYVLQHESPTFVLSTTWSPEGKRLLTTSGNDEQGAKDHTARIWDGETGKELLVFGKHAQGVWPGDWSPNGLRVATASNDGSVRVWDSFTGNEYLTLKIPVLYASYTWWSPDGKNLAIAGSETLVSVWRVWQTKEELIEYAKECCVFRELTDAERTQFGLD